MPVAIFPYPSIRPQVLGPLVLPRLMSSMVPIVLRYPGPHTKTSITPLYQCPSVANPPSSEYQPLENKLLPPP